MENDNRKEEEKNKRHLVQANIPSVYRKKAA